MNILPLKEFTIKYPEDIVWFYQYPFSLPPPIKTPPMDWFCKAVAEQGFKHSRAIEIYNKMSKLLTSLNCYDWNPIIIFSLSDYQLTKIAGYSKSKVETIRRLAGFWIEYSMEEIKQLTNDEIIKLLLPIKGIGMWTVNYFLSRQLGRKVIWVEDRLPRIGLQFVLDLPKIPTIKEARDLAQKRWGEYAYFGVMIMFQIGHYKYYAKKYFQAKN